MLQVKNLNMTHRRDLRTILEDFSLSLNAGDKAVIIGEEGNGKSTLLKWIYDPELVEDYVEAAGENIHSGEKLGYLPQELSRAEHEKTIYEFFCEEERFFEASPRELNRLTGELDLAEGFFYGEQKMGTLSGGERIKAQMARLLIGEPTVFLLDEPSNDIDIPTLEWMEKWIGSCPQAVLFVSHDETLIERTANMVIHLEQLRRKTVCRYTVARMAYSEYRNQRAANMENQERQAMNERREEKIRQEKWNRIQQSVEHDLQSVSRQDPHGGRLLKKKMKAVKSLEKRYEREAQDRTEMPETEDAIFLRFGEDIRIPPGKTVLDFSMEKLCAPGEEERILAGNLALRIRGNEKVCIVGRNGAGKSTLLRRIAEEMLTREDLSVVYMPQNYEERLPVDKTPVEFLSVTGEKEEITRIRTYLGSMKYTAEEMGRPAAELSGGQKAKLFLLKMSLQGADVLLLDEPTRNFSPLSGPVIREVLAGFGGAILAVSHDRKFIGEVCSTVYELTEQGLIMK